MGFFILAILPFVRAIMVYILPLLYTLIGKNFPLSSK